MPAVGARCPACGLWRVVRWVDYLRSPDDVVAFCDGTPLGRWLNSADERWEDAA